MSVLVRGMNIPEKCARCKLEKSDPKEGYYCSLLPVMKDWTTNTREKCRLPDCPLFPVPAHGRLINADAEVEVWDVCGRQGVFPHFTTTVSKFLLGHLVGEIPPTIIQAEEGE